MRAYVTTSWDDGGAYDWRLAELLQQHGIKGSLYWTVDQPYRPLPSQREIDEILALDVEIGSHTMTHPDLTAIDEDSLRWELVESKSRLEELTGREVSSFCYPSGFFNRKACNAVEAAGYRLGRTTVGFRKDLGSDPYHMPVTIQIHPHSRNVHLRHALKERNMIGLGRWLTSYRAGADLVALVTKALADVRGSGGVLHLWGHAWELEENDQWRILDHILELVSNHGDVSYVTNGELMADAGASTPRLE